LIAAFAERLIVPLVPAGGRLVVQPSLLCPSALSPPGEAVSTMPSSASVQAMTRQRTLLLIVYAPALVDNDGRTLAVVHGIERALPGVRLEWELSQAGRPIALPHREGWLAEASARGKFPLLCNGDESYPVTVTGWGRPARLSAGGQPQFEVHAELPLDAASIAAAVDML
jgi:hypothetical protein